MCLQRLLKLLEVGFGKAHRAVTLRRRAEVMSRDHLLRVQSNHLVQRSAPLLSTGRRLGVGGPEMHAQATPVPPIVLFAGSKRTPRSHGAA